MHRNSMESRNVSRRGFVKGIGAATGAALAAGGNSRLAMAGTFSASLPDLQAALNACTTDEDFWKTVRREFLLDPAIIYMNTGTEGAMAGLTVESLKSGYLAFAANPMGACYYNPTYSYEQKPNRTKVAAFLGADPEEVAFTMNTTHGLNLILNALPFQSGDEIITTLHDHAALPSPLDCLRDRRGIVPVRIALPTLVQSRQEIVYRFASALTPRTKALAFSHINYTNGLRMPVRELCDLARAYGLISIVDGAHTPGMIELNLHDIGCDFYCCSGHKWLNGPAGTGVLYIRNAPSNPWSVRPVMTELYDSLATRPITDLFQYSGQHNTPAYTAVAVAVDFVKTVGQAKIEQRVKDLNSYFKKKVVEQWGDAALLSTTLPEFASGMGTFNPFLNHYDMMKIISFSTRVRTEYNIITRFVGWLEKPGGPTRYGQRVSTHLFNEEKDVDSFLDAAAKAVASIGR